MSDSGKSAMGILDRTVPKRLILKSKADAVFVSPAKPVGLDDAILLLAKKAAVGISSASAVFNLLVPSKRVFTRDKQRINPPGKYMLASKVETAKIAPGESIRTVKGPLDICYVANYSSAYYLEDLISYEISELKKLGKLSEEVDAQGIFNYIYAITKKCVLTAHGMAPEVYIIDTSDKLKELYDIIKAHKGPVILDIETDGLDPHSNKIVGIGIALEAGLGYYIPITKPATDYAHTFSIGEASSNKTCKQSEIRDFVVNALADKAIVAHNAKFEYQFFKTHYNTALNIIQDTMVGEYILDCRLKGRFNLGDSVKERFPMVEEWKESKDFFKNLINLPISKVANYCVKDCCNEYLLFMTQAYWLIKDYDYIHSFIDTPFIKIVAEAELEGFGLDCDYLTQLNKDLNKKVQDIDGRLRETLGEINLDSSQQLAKVLYEDMGFEVVKRTDSGAPSVDSDTIELLKTRTGNEIFSLLSDRRGFKKLAATYTTSFIEKRSMVTGNIHPSFMITDTETGRLSCRNPNVQNLPKNASDLIRRGIIAPENCTLIFSDYSGQELRILAAACRDEHILRAYNPCYKCIYDGNFAKCPKLNPELGMPDYCRQLDLHDLVTSKVFAKQVGDTPIWEISKKFKSLRSIAKAVSFLLVYGGSEMTLSQRTGISLDEAKEIFKEYFASFPGIKPWIREMYQFALDNGYSQDALGRRRYYDILMDSDYNSEDCPFYKKPSVDADLRVRGMRQGKEPFKKVMGALRQSQNHPIQGTAAEMTKQGALFASARLAKLPFRAKIIGFVHDEIITVCPKNREQILLTVEEIRKAMTEDIPLVEKYGFPECLKMSVGISAGDNWGQAISINEYVAAI